MNSRTSVLAAFLLLSIFTLPALVHAGGIPFFGPIIPQNQATCAGGWGLLIVVINNIISLLLTLAIVFVAPVMIAYSGFLFVVNPVNPSGKEKAKSYLTNTIVGIVIALSAWFIVDAVMAVLYNQSTWGATWASLLSPGSGDQCIFGGQTSSSGSTSSSASANGGGTPGLIIQNPNQ